MEKKRVRKGFFDEASLLVSLIGKEVTILSHTDPGLKGLKGRVVDETRKTIVIETGGKRKRVLKKHVVLCVEHRGRKYIVYGERIEGSIPEKIKRVSKKLKL